MMASTSALCWFPLRSRFWETGTTVEERQRRETKSPGEGEVGRGGMRKREIRSTVWEAMQTRDVRALPSSPQHLPHYGTLWFLVLR